MHYVVYAQFYADHWDPELKKELLQKVLEAPEDELQCFLEESELFFGEIKAISQGKKEMIEGL